MSRRRQLWIASGIVITLGFCLPVGAYESAKNKVSRVETDSGASASLWRDPGDISLLNLRYGSGGKAHEPAGKFKFVKEDKEGTSAKFDIEDEQGVRWRAKLGEEAKPETAAIRLLWAVGYFADEDYYLPELRVEGMQKLSRGNKFISADGVIRGARLKRGHKEQKKVGNWSWFDNPFVGTKELNGLKTMMALMNNWDLKEINNAIYDEGGGVRHYEVSDVGATFGRTGNRFTRSKSNLKDYRKTKFIQRTAPEQVDFFLSSRPFFLMVINVPDYITRTKMQGIVKKIPRTHAKWVGQLLGRLSAEQIRDCFRAAGYSPEEVEGFAKVVQGRIAELNQL
jgi:hypothetical protein